MQNDGGTAGQMMVGGGRQIERSPGVGVMRDLAMTTDR